MPHSIRPLLQEDTLRARVAQMAEQISADYADADELFLIGVLRGCYIFLADLSRLLTIPRRVDFIGVSAYGRRESTAPGAVRLLMDVRSDLVDRHVLIVEDIIDTGHTLAYLTDLLRARRPASLRTCALLRKPDRVESDITVDYLGFDIPDVWVVGYGLDYADRLRALPYIGVIDPDEF